MTLEASFATMGLGDAILALDEMETAGDSAAIPRLMEAFAAPAIDDAVRRAIGDTLRALLPGSEDQLLSGLRSADPTLRRLCLQVVEAGSVEAAVPALVELAESEADAEALSQILSALSFSRASEALALFRRHAAHTDAILSAFCLGMLGAFRDRESLPTLVAVVEQSDADGSYEICSVAAQKAIEALGALEGEEPLSFLVSKLHHRNPTARRFVHEQVLGRETAAVPHLAKMLENGDVDTRVLAANLLGIIGGREAGNALVAAFDRGKADDPNVRFAVYEALGHATSLKGVVCLADGLSEDDDTTLMAVVSSLEQQSNPGVVASLKAALGRDPTRREKIVRALVASRAFGLLAAAFDDEPVSEAVIRAIKALRDPDATEEFRAWLQCSESPRARAAVESLTAVDHGAAARRLLAVDDSKSMLLFYKGAGANLGWDVSTAANGKEAMDLIESGQTFDAVITDLNMPVMDGLELTRRLRDNLFTETTPILMATTESEVSQRDLAQKAGVNGFLNKPIRPAVLEEALAALL